AGDPALPDGLQTAPVLGRSGETALARLPLAIIPSAKSIAVQAVREASAISTSPPAPVLPHGPVAMVMGLADAPDARPSSLAAVPVAAVPPAGVDTLDRREPITLRSEQGVPVDTAGIPVPPLDFEPTLR